MTKGFSKWIRKQEGYVEPEVTLEAITKRSRVSFFGSLSRQQIGVELSGVAKERLLSSFPWSESPQGFKYWNELYEGTRLLTEEDRIIFEKSYMLV